MKRIESITDGRCFQVVRTLCNALMGKVEAAVELTPVAHGRWAVPAPPHRFIAIKQLYKHCVESGRTLDGRAVRENPMQEIAVLALMGDPGHVNVMRLLHFLEDAERLYLVIEFLDGGELFGQVSAHGHASEEAARRYMWQVILGTRFMHARGIAHRDISLENAMLSSEPAPQTVKLIDFGLAVPIPRDGSLIRPDMRVGKERYMPPEIWGLQPYNPVQGDVWTLGISVYVLLFGVYPYQAPSAVHCPYFAQIATGGLVAMLRSWNYHERVSDAALSFLEFVLQADPVRRPSLDAMLMHAWFAPIRDMLPVGALELVGLPPPLQMSGGVAPMVM